MNAPSSIAEDLCLFVKNHALSDVPVHGETDLLESGLLDSMLVMDMVFHIETHHGVRLDDEDITPEHFRRIGPLAELIAAKMIS